MVTTLNVIVSPSTSVPLSVTATLASSFNVDVLSLIVGVSFTATIVIVTVEVLLSAVPSFAFHVKVSVPFQLAFGV